MSKKKNFMPVVRNAIIFNIMETMRWLSVRIKICVCS